VEHGNQIGLDSFLGMMPQLLPLSQGKTVASGKWKIIFFSSSYTGFFII